GLARGSAGLGQVALGILEGCGGAIPPFRRGLHGTRSAFGRSTRVCRGLAGGFQALGPLTIGALIRLAWGGGSCPRSRGGAEAHMAQLALETALGDLGPG